MNIHISFFIFLGIYLTAITAEALYGHYQQKKIYNIKDSLVNVFFGISGVLARFLTKGAWLALWYYLYQFSLFRISSGVVNWIILYMLNELVYYWFHRLSHEHRVLWAVHVNHHSSEHLNFTTAARVPFLNFLLHNIFWIPLVLIGFDPLMIFAVENIGFLFAFFQHTQVIRKIPYLEYILNTPSHHRVHHAANKEYQNKNYGNTLIIFDRLFGTFKQEEDDIAIRYGLLENIHTYNPVKVIFHEWVNIFKKRKN